jgi:hypothetical protein
MVSGGLNVFGEEAMLTYQSQATLHAQNRGSQ